MRNKEIIESQRFDNYNKLSNLKTLIDRFMEAGATHVELEYDLSYTDNPVEWIKFYREKSAEEIKTEKINDLKRQLKELEG